LAICSTPEFPHPRPVDAFVDASTGSSDLHSKNAAREDQHFGSRKFGSKVRKKRICIYPPTPTARRIAHRD
jgi:hypothetical protein